MLLIGFGLIREIMDLWCNAEKVDGEIDVERLNPDFGIVMK
jgi:hypothetical protein